MKPKHVLVLVIALVFVTQVRTEDGRPVSDASGKKARVKKNQKRAKNPRDAKNKSTGNPEPARDPEYAKYGIYQKTAPRARIVRPMTTKLPLKLNKGDRIALIGNTLFERSLHFGYFEAMLHLRFPDHHLVVRNLAWPADESELQPRPANFADVEQHLHHEKVDVIFAAFGFNESFAGKAGLAQFRKRLSAFVAGLKLQAFNSKTGPRIVLVSPIANENVDGVPAADLNNDRIQMYVDAIRDVAKQQQVGFVDVFKPTLAAMRSLGSDLTFNGVHLVGEGYRVFSEALYKGAFGEAAMATKPALRDAIVDKNRQFFRRYRPVNTFYYTGGRNKSYGYLDFLPAMKNFEIMVANRDRRIWSIARGEKVSDKTDDSNLPPLPKTKESRGANQWMTAKEELKSFKIDPRFEVNLFAGEEEFPDIAAPIQMRWDSRGRLWVSCSTTYPHVYPGNEANDKLVILEDTNGDGRADKSTVFADDLHIPL